MTEQHKAFLADMLNLMEKHQLVIVPTYEGKPSAHDPMYIVPLDDFWRNFVKERIYSEPT